MFYRAYAYVRLAFRYIVDVLPLRAFLSLWFSRLYPSKGKGLLSPERLSQQASEAGMVFSAQVQERLSRGSESVPTGLGGLPGRGVRVKGYRASERLSGVSTGVSAGEPRQDADRSEADIKIPGKCQGVKSKRDKFLKGLTAIKIICYNSRFFRNGHFGHFVYVRFIMIYGDLSSYNRQNGQI